MSNAGPARTVALCLHEKHSLGGSGISVARLIPTLSDRGWRFLFWCAKPSPLYDELRGRGLDVHGAPRQVGYSLEALRAEGGVLRSVASWPPYVRAFRRFLTEHQPEVVHANTFFDLAEARLASAWGFPVLFHIHGVTTDGWKLRALARLAYGRRIEVVAVSEACAALIPNRRAKPRIVFGGVPIPPAAGARPDHKPLVVGTVGVVARRNGSDLFVEAARRILARRNDIEFHIIGNFSDVLEAEWGSGLIERARRLGIRHTESADVFATFRGWDVFALPSRTDAFPNVVLEAMASSLPVVASDVGGIPEQVTGETGILVADEDPEGLAQAILTLADDPELRRSMGKAGRRRVERNFTLDRQANGIERAYMELIERVKTG